MTFTTELQISLNTPYVHEQILFYSTKTPKPCNKGKGKGIITLV